MPIAVPAFFSALPVWTRGPALAPWPAGLRPLPGLTATIPAGLGPWQDQSEPAGLAVPEPVRAALQRFLLAPWKPAVDVSALAEAQRSMIAPDHP
ncbi:hypothetical protein [Caldinitratiruptor microaerophilus]|uniref:Uncharacterized protein n=1 Tax=Caldinitratiruptor microaerophilus TaxID=671077 RepID=A0AA35CMW9_9FIRM|nr:hypothetical protein [Caldinitratiruptor microaerophilus]BDG60296.1 hypothetical protein caldi_13860 [Caldinitratiruptor microaerophilus]